MQHPDRPRDGGAMQPSSGFGAGWAGTLLQIATTRDLVLTMVLAVVFYAFYYPLPYRQQATQSVPVIVVDEENTPATRALAQALGDTREVAVAGTVGDYASAVQAVKQRQADGIVLLPAGLTRALAAGEAGAGVGVWMNGAYLTRASAIGTAVKGVVLDAVRRQAGPLADQIHRQAPAELVVRPLFNPVEGYASYVYPAVSLLILQQTLLFGSAMLIATRRRAGRLACTPGYFLGTLSALVCVGTGAAAFFFGWAFWAEDMPRTLQLGHLAWMVPLYAATVASLGMAIGSYMPAPERAMMWLAPTSIVLFFMTGAAWPLDQMPRLTAWLAQLSPATAGVQAFVPINQMGASPADVARWLTLLAVLFAVYGAWASWRLCGGRRTLPPSGHIDSTSIAR